jgi:hypothetical protein
MSGHDLTGRTASWVVWTLGFCSITVACSGTSVPTNVEEADNGGDVGSAAGGVGVTPERKEENLPADPFAENWRPAAPCTPTLAKRVRRLSDRHLANAMRDLLSLPAAPAFQTTSGSRESFIPNKAAALDGAAFVKLQGLAEDLAAKATAAGAPLVACAADSATCARTFINKFVARAFRHPLTAAETEKLMTVYQAGALDGGYAAGIRLIIETALQSPSFVYQTELGQGADKAGKLSSFELAAKISFFLRDGLPDDELWEAALNGGLDTPAGVNKQVDRLMATAAVKANISSILQRMFALDRLFDANKDPSFKEFTPELVKSMHDEATRFIGGVLESADGTIEKLLTSRKTSIDSRLAAIYGIAGPTGAGLKDVELPATERAGFLTQAAFTTLESTPNDSSVVHRGVFMVRELLCFFPPPPAATDLAAAEDLKKVTYTERERADKRAMTPRCAGCHAYFDPLGVSLEHYDTMGRYRTTIKTPNGDVPVDSTRDATIFDVRGKILDGVDLSARLAKSGAVRECLSRQFASYALGSRLSDEDVCTVAKVNETFNQTNGNFKELVRAVASWPALRDRQGVKL